MPPQTYSVDADLFSWTELKERHSWSGILIGNGASRAVWNRFGYKSLYQTAKSGNVERLLSSEDQSIFEEIGTENFEQILAALATSKIVCDALGLDSTLIDLRYKSIQEALFEAVSTVHVPWKPEDVGVYQAIRSALLPYDFVYSTNYDLILYWSIMSEGGNGFKDYFFGDDEMFNITDTEVWGKFTKVLYLHGGIHLARLPFGGTLKRFAEPPLNLIESLEFVRSDGAVPLFITEGTSKDKLSSIYSSDYLSFAYQQFAQHHGPLVVFGHSFGESDDHLIDALSRRENRRVAISVFPNMSSHQTIAHKARIQERLSPTEILFFDSTTHPLGSSNLGIAEANNS